MRHAIALGARALVVMFALAACRGGERKDVSADTALTRAVRAAPDSAGRDSVSPPDSNTGAGRDSNPTEAPSDRRPARTSRETLLTRDDSIGGNLVYLGHGRCFTCHNQQGEGVPSVGPSLIDAEWLDSDGSYDGIFQAIARGVATPKRMGLAMPSFRGQLTDREMHDVAAYVYLLSHVRAPADSVSTSRGDSTRAATPPAAKPHPPHPHA